ncbi:MAG: DUF3667 domain-containing protein [Saprospiraceae bacterium]
MNTILNRTHCLNCDTPFVYKLTNNKEIFCRNCGQSSKAEKLLFFNILSDAAKSIFNFDSRLIHTLRDIIFPSKLTNYYVAGKRKYYVNPIKLFIITLIALITSTLFFIKIPNLITKGGKDYYKVQLEKDASRNKFDAIIDTLEGSKDSVFIQQLRLALYKDIEITRNDTLTSPLSNIGYLGGKVIKDYGISTHDALTMSTDSLLNKYEVVSFWDKLRIKQFLKIYSNPEGGLRYLIKNLTWILLITVLLIAILMKVIYLRSSCYYVEHLVLTLNSHSLTFVLLTITILIRNFFSTELDQINLSSSIFSMNLYLILGIQFFTIKKYYKQGIFKTLVKQIIINTTYFIIFFMSAIFVSMVIVFLY